MKLLIFEVLFLFFTISGVIGQENKKTENKLIPHHSKFHYAGSMGLLSAGLGWSYGNSNNWETDFIVGYIPKYTTDKAKICITLKENYIPWKIRLKKTDFHLEPLTSSVYVNTILGEEFWTKAPYKYPESYYKFSTKIRFNISVGQRITYKMSTVAKTGIKSVSAFYEISTNDLYIVSANGKSNLKPADYLHLSLGVGFSWKS